MIVFDCQKCTSVSETTLRHVRAGRLGIGLGTVDNAKITSVCTITIYVLSCEMEVI